MLWKPKPKRETLNPQTQDLVVVVAAAADVADVADVAVADLARPSGLCPLVARPAFRVQVV